MDCAEIFAKKESRSPRGFLPRPLLRAGEIAFRTPPPFPQTKEAGCGQDFFSKKVRAKDTISPQKTQTAQTIVGAVCSYINSCKLSQKLLGFLAFRLGSARHRRLLWLIHSKIIN